MAHDSQLRFIADTRYNFPKFFKSCRVLEIGSLDINGSVRQFFEDCDFTGVDIGPGNGVDVVCQGQLFAGEDKSYDTVLSCECFEHNPFWLETFFNMWRMAKPGGFVLFTCATTGRPEHGTAAHHPYGSPLTVEKGWNYYQNLTESDFRAPLNFDYLFERFQFVSQTNREPQDLLFWGIKRSAPP